MKELIEKVWKLNRSIVSWEYNKALECIKEEIDLKILSYKSGEEYWTWKIPRKWELEEAYLLDIDTGEKLLDASDNLLHVVIGSLPFDAEVDKEKIVRHLHYDKKRPEFIPCIYKYYDHSDWGFCCTKSQYERILKSERFRVVIKANYSEDELKIGEYTVQGKSPKTIYVVAHLDGPHQANDNLSGVSVSVDIAKELSKKNTYYTYKFIFIPGTIGSIVYAATNQNALKDAIGAIVPEMVGNDNELCIQQSLQGEQYIDKVLEYVLSRRKKEFNQRCFCNIIYPGGRTLNSPGIDIPTTTLVRHSDDRLFPYYEYHTSGDTIDIIKEENLVEARDIILEAIDIIENDYVPVRNYIGIPFVAKYGLWVDRNQNPEKRTAVNNILFLLDNKTSIFEIARKLTLDIKEVQDVLDKLIENKLVEKKAIT